MNSCFRCFRCFRCCFRCCSDPPRATHPAAATHPRAACGLPPPGSRDPPPRQLRPTRKLLVTHPAIYKKFLRLRRAIRKSSSPAAGSCGKYSPTASYATHPRVATHLQPACDPLGYIWKGTRLRRDIPNHIFHKSVHMLILANMPNHIRTG